MTQTDTPWSGGEQRKRHKLACTLTTEVRAFQPKFATGRSFCGWVKTSQYVGLRLQERKLGSHVRMGCVEWKLRLDLALAERPGQSVCRGISHEAVRL